MESIPDYKIDRFYCGVTTYSELTIVCYGKRFHIETSAEDLHGNLQLEMEYLERLRKLEIDYGMLPIQHNNWQKSLIGEIYGQKIQGKDDVDVDNDEMVVNAMEEGCFWIASKCITSMKALGSDTDLQPVTVE